MQSTIPTAEQTVIRFIEKGICDSAFAPVYLSAKLDRIDGESLLTDLVRNHESLWGGKAYRGEMEGHTSSYPSIDLSLFPWKFPEQPTFASVRDGNLRSEMQRQLDAALAALPFKMRPLNGKSRPWHKSFLENGSWRYVYFELIREDDTPEWITGLDSIRMSGSWRVFLPNPSPERDIVEQMLLYERRSAQLEELRSTPPISIASKEDELEGLRHRLQAELEKLGH